MDFFEWAGVRVDGGRVLPADAQVDDFADGSDVPVGRVAELIGTLIAADPPERIAVVRGLSVAERAAVADNTSPAVLGRLLLPLRYGQPFDVDAVLLRRAVHRSSHRKATEAAVHALGGRRETAERAVRVGVMNADTERFLLAGNDLTQSEQGPFPDCVGSVTELVAALRPLTDAEQRFVVASGRLPMYADRISTGAVMEATGVSTSDLARSVRWLGGHDRDAAARLLAERLARRGADVVAATRSGWEQVATLVGEYTPECRDLLGDRIREQAAALAAENPRGRVRGGSPWLWAPHIPSGRGNEWLNVVREATATFDAPLAVVAECGHQVPHEVLSWALHVWQVTRTLPSADGLVELLNAGLGVPGLALAAGQWWNAEADVSELAAALNTSVRLTAETSDRGPGFRHDPVVPSARLAAVCNRDSAVWALGAGQLPAGDWLAAKLAGVPLDADMVGQVAELRDLSADEAVAGFNGPVDVRVPLLDWAPQSVLTPNMLDELNADASAFLSGWLRANLGDAAEPWTRLANATRYRSRYEPTLVQAVENVLAGRID